MHNKKLDTIIRVIESFGLKPEAFSNSFTRHRNCLAFCLTNQPYQLGVKITNTIRSNGIADDYMSYTNNLDVIFYYPGIHYENGQ